MTEAQLENARRYRERHKKPCVGCGAPVLRTSTRCRACVAPAQQFLRAAVESNTDECLEWPFHRARAGYGRLGVGRDIQLAHRRAYELANDISLTDEWVLHRCDNPPCINPRHLFLGDRQDNVDDMVKKKRQAFGERSGAAKLDDGRAREILGFYEAGCGQRELGRRFGVTLATIQALLRRETWTHV